MKITSLFLLFFMAINSYAATIENNVNHSLKGVNKILIFNGDGNVNITAKKGIKSLQGNYTIAMSGSTSLVNKHIENEMTIYSKIDKNKLTLKFGYDAQTKKSQKKAITNINLIVPDDIFIDLRSNNGDISLSNLTKGARIIDKKGHISITNVSGFMSINDGSGDITIQDTKSKLKVNDTKGSIIIKNHDGDLIINDKSGVITLSDTDGKIKISDGSGNIKIKRHIGFIKVTDKKGHIEIDESRGNIKIKSKSGEIELTNIEGDVKILTKNQSDIITKNVSGEITHSK
ncbi:DUF4097 family beta strand repeat-containing protein [Cognaticolwellia mytili]|uniref:hypothetical protein n=1 Tax=Cognaticolwellia mytili TaxID=1888913 RepID=UPI000A1757F4|nr:hypothetical protein [Cognaticolwellia mytili]